MEKLFTYIEENGNDPGRYVYMVGYGYNIKEGEDLRKDVIEKMKKKFNWLKFAVITVYFLILLMIVGVLL